MKTMLGPFSVWQLICARSLLTAVVLVPAILIIGPPHRLLTPLWRLHVCRAFLFAVGFSLYYSAFPFMTLASVTTIFFAAPLITAVLATVFLKEKIGLHRIGALIAGFAGVMVTMNPGGETFQWISVLPLICALTYATSQTIVRRIGETETSLTTGFYTIVLAGVFVLPMGWGLNTFTDVAASVPHIRWHWDAVALDDVVRLLVLGVLGMIGYILLSRAYQISEVSAVAPLEYSYIPMAALLGYLFWDEVPTLNTLVGMGLIVTSGIYIGYRELISARRKVAPAPTRETVFVPASPPPPPA